MYAYMFIYIYTYIYIYMHTYIYIGIYTHVGVYCTRHEHGNDSLFHAAVEKDSLIAVLWHFSR